MILTLVTALALAQSKAPLAKAETLIGISGTSIDPKGRPEVKIVFRGGRAKWETVRCDPKETPAKVHWKVCGGGEVDTHVLPPTTDPEEEGPVGTVHQLSDEKATLPSEMTLLTTGSCADPEGWKPVHDNAIDEGKMGATPAMATAFADLHGKMEKSMGRPATPIDPKSLYVVQMWAASDGRRLDKVAWQHPGQDETDYPFETLYVPIWVLVEKGGAAKPLEIGNQLLGVADLDGDGHSDFLFEASSDLTQRYILRASASAGRSLWENTH